MLYYIISLDLFNGDRHLQALGLETLKEDDDHSRFNAAFIQAFIPRYTGSLPKWNRNFVCSSSRNSAKADALSIDLANIRKKWRLFETFDGSIGIGPRFAKKGDGIFVLYGSSMPVILRRKKGGNYIHVGTCFVIDIMNGEASSSTAFEKSIEKIQIE